MSLELAEFSQSASLRSGDARRAASRRDDWCPTGPRRRKRRPKSTERRSRVLGVSSLPVFGAIPRCTLRNSSAVTSIAVNPANYDGAVAQADTRTRPPEAGHVREGGGTLSRSLGSRRASGWRDDALARCRHRGLRTGCSTLTTLGARHEVEMKSPGNAASIACFFGGRSPVPGSGVTAFPMGQTMHSTIVARSAVAGSCDQGNGVVCHALCVQAHKR